MLDAQIGSLFLPVKGCCVRCGDQGERGTVRESTVKDQSAYVNVLLQNGQREWFEATYLRCGFRKGDTVQDSPRSNTARTLGVGTVLNVRELAGREQVLVQLQDSGDTRWMPYQNLVLIRGVKAQYLNPTTSTPDAGERFRLKALAHILDYWNQVTGALDRLDVHPLPHQINLVHHIMNSDHSNWLIADDVGLGKTIEVGLLLAAKKRRRQARRVLVVCPAGMVRQWQDEMRYKFNEDFRIYGDSFLIDHASQWPTYEKVIVSIDRAKSDTHLPVFNDSKDWDVIIFDEAHHLSKIEHQAVTQRYRLAERLRSLTDSFIFLSGTPHQGNSDQFINLLHLLRPDLTQRFHRAFTDPSVVAEVVLRNRKSQVTDASGNFLFRGQKTHLVNAPVSEEAKQFDDQLQVYLRNGYTASAMGGNTGRAIGFVMTIYRKLASSSIAAIERALQRRVDRLQGAARPAAVSHDLPFGDESFDEDAFLEGTDARDDMESLADVTTRPFFDNEQAQIDRLLVVARRVREDDLKLKAFLSGIVDPLYKQGKKLVVFTEYRATQEYLVEALQDRYPGSGVAQINGGMSLGEKRTNIENFNERAAFMVSTEAGGEGINLHLSCHVLANYDLPWNPARLVQRSGRLYRYGQTERVIVFNLLARDGFDNKALGKMLERVFNMTTDMSEVSSEYDYDVQQVEIIGEMLERVDVAAILAANKEMDLDRTDSDIADAIARAQEAQSQQEKLFSHVEGYDPQAAVTLSDFGPDTVLAFLEGILKHKGIRIRSYLHNGKTLELQLPDDLRGWFSEFPPRATIVRVTVDRERAVGNPGLAMLDFASEFFRYLIDFAKSPEFKGEYADLEGPMSGTLALYKLRWQDGQGVLRWDALLPIFLPKDGGDTIVNPDFFHELLVDLESSKRQSQGATEEDRRQRESRLNRRAEEELAKQCTTLRQPNDCLPLALADITAPVRMTSPP